ncbi:unnamed protein product, partial [Hapterophycus canaliculatus]
CDPTIRPSADSKLLQLCEDCHVFGSSFTAFGALVLGRRLNGFLRGVTDSLLLASRVWCCSRFDDRYHATSLGRFLVFLRYSRWRLQPPRITTENLFGTCHFGIVVGAVLESAELSDFRKYSDRLKVSSVGDGAAAETTTRKMQKNRFR